MFDGFVTQKTVTFIHLFIIGPALSAIGLNKDKIPLEAFPVITFAGFVVALMHLAIALRRGWSDGFLDLVKAFTFAPLMIYIGMEGRNASDVAYSAASAAVPAAVFLNAISKKELI